MPTYRRPRKPRPPKESTMQDILEKREQEKERSRPQNQGTYA